jgi:ribosomal protein S18 acetylase RimI-like enzyme
MEERVWLRPATSADRAFLYRVYASSREDEMALVDWDEARKHAFLRMQFDAQNHHYHQNYATAKFQVILFDGEPVGRLYVDRWPSEIRIVDIAILAPHRRKGIGEHLLRQIMVEGERADLPVSIHVEQFNPAIHFYVRLGFRIIATHGLYYLMEWSSHNAGSESPEGR